MSNRLEGLPKEIQSELFSLLPISDLHRLSIAYPKLQDPIGEEEEYILKRRKVSDVLIDLEKVRNITTMFLLYPFLISYIPYEVGILMKFLREALFGPVSSTTSLQLQVDKGELYYPYGKFLLTGSDDFSISGEVYSKPTEGSIYFEGLYLVRKKMELVILVYREGELRDIFYYNHLSFEHFLFRGGRKLKEWGIIYHPPVTTVEELVNWLLERKYAYQYRRRDVRYFLSQDGNEIIESNDYNGNKTIFKENGETYEVKNNEVSIYNRYFDLARNEFRGRDTGGGSFFPIRQLPLKIISYVENGKWSTVFIYSLEGLIMKIVVNRQLSLVQIDVDNYPTTFTEEVASVYDFTTPIPPIQVIELLWKSNVELLTA